MNQIEAAEQLIAALYERGYDLPLRDLIETMQEVRSVFTPGSQRETMKELDRIDAA
jgi:hypothetical protein